MKENEIRSLFKILADEAVPPSEVNVWPGIQQSYQNHPLRNPRVYKSPRNFGFVMVGSAVILIALIFFVGPQNVVAAFRSLVGYLPGIGFVQNTDQGYVLSAPVSQERDGIRVTVLEAYADSQQTLVVYEIYPLPPETASEIDAPASPYLVLVDGSMLNLTHGDGGGKDGQWHERLGFPPLENRTQVMTLTIPRLHGQAAGAAPENWQIQFRLVPALENSRLRPAIDLTPVSNIQQTEEGKHPIEEAPTVVTSPNNSTNPEMLPASTDDPYTSPKKNGVQLHLKAASQTDGKIILEMMLGWDDSKWRLSSPWGKPDMITITDAKGRLLTITPGDPPLQPSDPHRITDSQIFTIPEGAQGPFTVTLDQVDFRASSQGSFSFNPGSSPKVGQAWTVDQKITVGGHDLYISGARLLAGNREQTCLQFDMKVDAGIESLALSDYDHFERVLGANASWNTGEGMIQTSVCYDVLPAGPLTIQIDSLFFTVTGPWQVAFNLAGATSDTAGNQVEDAQPTSFLDSATSNPVLLQAIVSEIEGYKQKRDALTAQPGWIYQKYEQQEFLPSSAPRPAPQPRVEEYWDHINADGKVYEQVQFWTSAETGRNLVGYRANGNLVSVWNGEQVVAQPFSPTYDLYLLSTLKGMIETQQPFQLSREETQLGGNPAICIDLWIPYNQQDRALMNIPLPDPVWGIYERFFMDSNTGKLLRYEHAYVLDNGDHVLSAVTSQMELQGNMTPPQEVFDIVGQQN